MSALTDGRTSRPVAADDLHAYSFDAENRIKQAENGSTATNVLAQGLLITEGCSRRIHPRSLEDPIQTVAPPRVVDGQGTMPGGEARNALHGAS